MKLLDEEPYKSKSPLSLRKRICLSIVFLILGIGIFVIAYIGMKNQTGLGKLNQPVLSWMVSHRGVNATHFAKIITSIASPLLFASIVGVLAVIWAVLKREIWRPLLLVGAMAAAAGTSMLLKTIFMDARPPQINMIPAFEYDFSFPSGHTIGMAVFLLVIGYLLYSRRFSSLRFWMWIAGAAVGTGIIALSRLYLGYHWLTDIVASVGLALIILAIVIVVDTIYIKRLKT